MNESILQLIAFFKIIWLAVFALLYGLGGMNNKLRRRLFGSLFITIGVCLFGAFLENFHWLYLLSFPFFFGALSLGYGADTTQEKVIRRFIAGLAAGFASIPIAIATGQWIMFTFGLVLCTATSIVFGVLNPVNARSEETFIATMYGIIPLFMV